MYDLYDLDRISIPKKPSKIHDVPVSNAVGITLWDHKTLQEVFERSGPLAKPNEFQFHYWALNLRKVFSDGSILDISIPTVLFNYKQEVSGAAIDFELKDVDEVSNAVLPLHDQEVSVLLDKLKAAKFPIGDYVLTSVNLNSVHRHPGGRSQSFSATDLRADHTAETGVVYPLSEGEKKPNFASIMAIVNGTCYLAHSEYRIAVGKVSDKEGITYYQGRTAAYVRAKTKTSEVESLFGCTPSVESYHVLDDMERNGALAYFTDIWDSIDYTPSTDLINASNLTKKSYSYARPPVTKSKKPAKAITAKPAPAVKSYSEDLDLRVAFCADHNIVTYAPDALVKLPLASKLDLYHKLEEHYYNRKVTPAPEVEDDELLELQEDVLEEFFEESQKPVAKSSDATSAVMYSTDIKVLEEFHRVYKVKLYLPTQLEKMDQRTLKAISNTLEEFQFGYSYADTSPVTVDDIIEVQEEIISDFLFCLEDY